MKIKVILSVAAHGDDAEFMAGGTLARMVDGRFGCQFHLIHAAFSSRAARRRPATTWVPEWYWYSKAHWETTKRVDITSTIERKIQALYAFRRQMVLTLDDLLVEARVMGAEESLLAGIDSNLVKPLIDLGVRANHARIGTGLGCEYAETFRYQTIELPEIFQS